MLGYLINSTLGQVWGLIHIIPALTGQADLYSRFLDSKVKDQKKDRGKREREIGRNYTWFLSIKI